MGQLAPNPRAFSAIDGVSPIEGFLEEEVTQTGLGH